MQQNSLLERLFYQLQDAQPLLLLTQQELVSRLPPWNGSSLCLEDLFDVLKIVPAHLAALLRELPRKELLPCRALILGGEALPGSLVQQIRDLGADCEVYNHYGPTETTIGVLMHALLPMHSLPDVLAPHLPLGEPLTNTQVYVLDETMMRITPLLFLIPPGFTSITLFYAHTIMRR